jgi:hypothetical protein
MDAGGEGDGGHSRGLDIASLVHRYGRSFVHSNPDIALEYYMRVSTDNISYHSNRYVGKYLLPVQLPEHSFHDVLETLMSQSSCYMPYGT